MTHTQLLEVLKKENLSTYFLLPLLGLDKLRFGGEKNFLNSYLSRDGLYIYAEVLDCLFDGTNLPENKVYIGPSGSFFLEFNTPEKWLPDVNLYMDGKYTQFSEKAKIRIRQGSTLDYNKSIGLSCKTDVRLLALESFPKLKDMWTDILYDPKDAVYRNEIGAELLSAPGDQCFLSVELSRVELTKV